MSIDLTSPRHKALAELLRKRRERAGLTQKEVAERLGVSQETVSAIERGDQRVSVVTYLDFAEVLGFHAGAGLRRVAAAKRR